MVRSVDFDDFFWCFVYVFCCGGGYFLGGKMFCFIVDELFIVIFMFRKRKR